MTIKISEEKKDKLYRVSSRAEKLTQDKVDELADDNILTQLALTKKYGTVTSVMITEKGKLIHMITNNGTIEEETIDWKDIYYMVKEKDYEDYEQEFEPELEKDEINFLENTNVLTELVMTRDYDAIVLRVEKDGSKMRVVSNKELGDVDWKEVYEEVYDIQTTMKNYWTKKGENIGDELGI